VINPIFEDEHIDLFIKKEAALKMLKHCKDFRDIQLEVMGFMVGHKYEWEGREYTVVEDVVTSDLDTTAVSVKFASFEPLFKKLDKFEKDGMDYLLVGWYHSHPGHTSFMSPTDKDTQMRMFKKEYQSAVVIDPINIEMKSFKLHEGEVYEKPYAILPGPDQMEGEEAEEPEAEGEEETGIDQEKFVEAEFVEAEMVESWPEEEEDYAVEDEPWEEEPGEIRVPYDYGVPTPAPAEARVQAPLLPEARQEYNPEPVAQQEGEGDETPKDEELDAFDYAWFAAPVLLGILGGLFGFFAVREKKSSLGNAMIVLGAISSLVWFASSYVLK